MITQKFLIKKFERFRQEGFDDRKDHPVACDKRNRQVVCGEMNRQEARYERSHHGDSQDRII